MDHQINVNSRMRKHLRSVKRLASSISGHPIQPDRPVSDGGFIVLLDKEGRPEGHHADGHPIAARHILDHYDDSDDRIYAPPSSPGRIVQVETLAEQGTGVFTSAVTDSRNDLSYDTMAVAFLVAAGGLLFFYLVLDFPRLLARLFSSPITKKRRHINNVGTLGDGSRTASVRTLGGEFWSGWFLKAGASERKPSVKTSPVITPNYSISAPFNEKQEYNNARTDSLRLPPTIPPHMQVDNRNMRHAQSDETLFSYYGSADSPQPPVPTVPYKPTEARQNQHTLRVITDISEAPVKVPSPPSRSRCLTGNLERMGSNESEDSVATAVSAETPEYKPYKEDQTSDMVAADSAYDNDFKEMNAFPRPQIYAPPPHIAPLFTYVPYLQKILLWTPLPRYLPHLTFASIILVCVYLFLVLFSTFFKSSVSFDSIGPDVLRSGMIGMMQIPIILGLGGRGSVFRFLLFGRYTGAAMRIHKLAGRLCFFGSAFHTGLWMRTWMQAGTLGKASKDQHIIFGYIAVGALALITLTSLPWVRQMAYGFFLTCHITGLVLLLVGLALHVPEAVPYCLAGACLYGADVAIRATRTRIATASLQAVPGCDSTMVSVAGVREGWRAGQHVILRVPKLGGLGGIEGHEFTIASAPDADGLTLIIKNAGNWSKRLLNMSLENEKSGAGLNTKVVVEGPYGGPGNMVFQSFSSVMLVAGGSGITHSLGIAHDLIRKASVPPYNVRARSVTIIWATRTKESVEGLLPSFNKLIECGHKAEQESPYGTTLRIYVYVTRQPASLPMRIESVVPPSMLIGGNRNSESTMTSQELSTSGVQIISGIRPNFEVSLNEMIESTGTLETGNSRGGLSRDVKPQGIAVAVCGPDALVVSAREAVRGIAQSKISRVGGIELLEESFCH